ncbi:MAG: RdgB/HAM1 family non-canonical purine NTP pyrophosphatase [Oscillospiraceae bacterium]|nr:RdgB/HAM1 family non-canonical purine NTP pyrophosphatase [Oscillospiraceae bacterium]
MPIVLATANPGKLAEIEALMSPLGQEIKTLADFGITQGPEENGATFEENAWIKAEQAVKNTALPALAEDSGLCVPALDGAPGILSARFGGCSSDRERNAHLLHLMSAVDDRRAYFICVAVFLYPDGKRFSAQGRLDGEILRQERGENGFGYDPVFFLPQKGKSMAELPIEEKSSLSHRGKALRQLLCLLTNQ